MPLWANVRAAVEQGKRPPVQATWPPGFVRLMQRCWAYAPADRPTFEEIIKNECFSSLDRTAHDIEL